MPEIKEISNRVFSLMEKYDITGYRLMKDCNIPEGTISQVKKGKYGFTVEQLINISNYFNVSLDWLIKGKEKKPSEEKEIIKALTDENFKYKSALEKYTAEIDLLDRVREMVSKVKKK